MRSFPMLTDSTTIACCTQQLVQSSCYRVVVRAHRWTRVDLTASRTVNTAAACVAVCTPCEHDTYAHYQYLRLVLDSQT